MAMPLLIDNPNTENLERLVARANRSPQEIDLFFEIKCVDPNTGPHAAYWLNKKTILTVSEAVNEEGNKLKLSYSPTAHSTEEPIPKLRADQAYSTVTLLGTFDHVKDKDYLLTQLGSLRENDEYSLFKAVWNFATTHHHPHPVTFTPVPHNPCKLPLVFLLAMTKSDEFSAEYDLPAHSWRIAATETPLEKERRVMKQQEERMRKQQEERVREQEEERRKQEEDRIRALRTFNNRQPKPASDDREPAAVVHEY
ncbi:hypothetical protein FB446DRAFT_794497 [Lentinula raphanica]|nr:hypothetical protein FB446DRAFT_794497 [Lentinula raphanica]